MNYLEFDTFEANPQESLADSETSIWPISAEVNLEKQELVVCTKTDIRFYDMWLGRLKKCFTHLMSPEEKDAIVCF